MAPNTPTIRQRRLGLELRRLREAVGMSAPAAAGALGTDRTNISNIEAGRYGIGEERLRRLVSIYECNDEALIDTLAAMTGGRKPGWWDEYRGKVPPGHLDISEIEHYAVHLRTVQTSHLPGLFHTEDHARAIFDLVVPKLPRLEVELRIAHRLARQRVVKGDKPVPYIGIIHEAALRMQLGGRDVARAQLHHLLDENERDNVTLLVIPFTNGGFPTVGDAVLYAAADNPHLDTVHMDSPAGPLFFDSPTQLENFRQRLDLAERAALTPNKSAEFIHSITKEM
ncbi:Scr1 family TA system antitoxin-like transcriptional regulator [Streptomyces europaeiscabiei]|uniref:Scr1 family TA system antitoxin-like transcriptional regulator n=1 Tax=Streptomyces europaeiscabiei TaxID=146819 RepID=UPI00099BB5B5|nr:Scr1 family TA system antitoxin-like transcriptional regulator [Streptomyces europaeiscabiei]MDX3669653.1 Scr1 family TA system antitoxin-like transcriptional regulator [Streptomyces europaeiscabiei]